jgi:rRNA maturation endonuclease Nob1
VEKSTSDEDQCFASETWKKARTSRELPDTEIRQQPWCDASLPDTQGEDTDAPSCTTVVLENLPRAFTQFQLLAELTCTVLGTFDLVYVPVDSGGTSPNYGMVNFTTHQHASQFKLLYDGRSLGDSKLVVKAAERQGFESNHAHFTDELRSRGESLPIFLREPLPTTRRSVRRKGRGPSMIDLAKKRQDVEQTERCKCQLSPEFLAATATDILQSAQRQQKWQTPAAPSAPYLVQQVLKSSLSRASPTPEHVLHQRTPTLISCKRCGVKVGPFFRFCPSCGSSLLQN